MGAAGAARVTEAFEPVRWTAAGASPLLLVCEHASNALPARFGDLGIDRTVQDSHVAWDIGAAGLARRLAARLDAPLVEGGVSRLVYDLNRPPEAPSAVPETSEIFAIPGNRGLGAAERAARAEAVYAPFVARLEALIEAARPAALVTIHSFTPVFLGRPRDVAVGVLHDADGALADALIAAAGDHLPWPAARNAPYGPADGVTTTLRRHALPRGLKNAMIEVRNDLLAGPSGEERMAALVAPWIAAALAAVGVPLAAEGAPCRG